MTPAGLTFWTFALLAVGLPLFFYPGVRSFAETTKHSVFASIMAGWLCAAGVALTAGFIANAAQQLFP